MDTPKKNQTRTTPLSKFEDSPVFNFINSLSPIKPVKSIHITHTFNSISFPSILHISPHREFKSPIRTNHPDPSKTTSPSKDETTVSTDEERVVVIDQFSEVSLGKSTEDSNSVFKLPENVKNDCYIACSNSIVKESSDKVLLEDEGNMERSCKIEQITEAAALDWESSISDGDELLIFRSSISIEAVELIQKPYQITGCTTSHFDPVDSNVRQRTDLVDPVNSYEFMTINSVDTADEEPISSSHRGLRRRCLDFETAGMPVKTADAGTKHSPSQPNEKLVTLTSSGSSSFRCTLPGIGLHLNALATRDCKHSIADAENLSSERQLSNPSCSSPFNIPHSSQEPLLTSGTSEREVDKNGVRLDDDAFLESAHLLGEELNQINPKKNRQWMENAEKIGACKRCNCKKSRCLKLYCECFAAGVYCIEPCSCQECFNKPIHEDVVLETRRQIESRNPLAFAPKVIVNADSVSELGDDSNKTPASARHKRGCNCKKSSCLKKYCECYQGGVGCSINCRCEGCKNAFGRKDALTGTETEQEEEEREICQKSSEMQNEEGQQNNPSCAATLTPPGPCRSLIPLPFEMKRKLPCSFLDDRSSSRLSVRFKLEKQSVIQTQPKIEKNMNMTCEDEVPETLCMDCPSGSGVKTVSPNSKRVGLPPHRQCEFEPSPSTRIGRRLILQSIPSFPSLPPEKARVNGPSKL